MSQPGTSFSGWAGWVWYGAVMLMIVGAFDIVQGIVALADDTFKGAVEHGVLVLDLTAWGWVHLVIGAVLLLTGIGLWSGQGWARVVGVVVATVNALAQLAVMLVYPFWALLMVALNMVVIYAIIIHGREAEEM